MEVANKVVFKFEINLQDMCMVKIASSIWGNKHSRRRVQFFLNNIYKIPGCFQRENKLFWNEHIIKNVLSLIKNLSLPNKFGSKLKHIIRSMGIKLFSWIRYITNVLPVNRICVEDLFWTQYGTLDKVQIFKIWVEKRRFKNNELFNIACFFYLKDYVSLLWERIPTNVRENVFYSGKIYKESIFCHIAYWKNYLEEKNNFFETTPIDVYANIRKASRSLPNIRQMPPFRIQEYRISRLNGVFANHYPDLDGLSLNMIYWSLFQGQEFSLQHFWDKLNNVREDDVLLFVRYVCLKERLPEYTDIIIFVVIKMFIKENYNFSIEESVGLIILLSNHPWDEFYLRLLDRISQSYPPSDYGGERKLDFLCLITKIVELMDNEFELYGSVQNSVYQYFLGETWNRIPRWAKLVEDESWNIKFNELLSKLLVMEDICSLKFILNDEVFRSKRYARMESVLWAYVGNPRLFMTLTDQQIELLNKFVDEIELKEDERKSLKTTYCKKILLSM